MQRKSIYLNGLTVAIYAVIGVLVCFFIFASSELIFKDKHVTFIAKNIMGKTKTCQSAYKDNVALNKYLSEL